MRAAALWGLRDARSHRARAGEAAAALRRATAEARRQAVARRVEQERTVAAGDAALRRAAATADDEIRALRSERARGVREQVRSLPPPPLYPTRLP
jgi:hypothetical protein